VRATQAVQRAAAGATLSDLSSTAAGTSTGSAGTAHPTVDHVVVLVQENHTTDNYLSGLAPWGVNVAAGWPVQPNPPTTDQPHDRHAYYQWLTSGKSTRAAFDTLSVLPFYSYLALTGALLENHCAGFGTNSTPNHLMIVGGQSPTMRNPPRTNPPVWDLPSLPGLADDHGVSWRCYCPYSGYPVSFYTQLKGSANVTTPGQFVTDVAGGKMASLSMVWHASPDDEHPPADVQLGQSAVRAAVDAVVAAGKWDRTVFLLTWDDWGGWDDHVTTPNVEHTTDGVQCAYGPRVPLLMFGGPVAATIAGTRMWRLPRPRSSCSDCPPLVCHASTTIPASPTWSPRLRSHSHHLQHPPRHHCRQLRSPHHPSLPSRHHPASPPSRPPTASSETAPPSPAPTTCPSSTASQNSGSSIGPLLALRRNGIPFRDGDDFGTPGSSERTCLRQAPRPPEP
jgi:hypothetical protein